MPRRPASRAGVKRQRRAAETSPHSGSASRPERRSQAAPSGAPDPPRLPETNGRNTAAPQRAAKEHWLRHGNRSEIKRVGIQQEYSPGRPCGLRGARSKKAGGPRRNRNVAANGHAGPPEAMAPASTGWPKPVVATQEAAWQADGEAAARWCRSVPIRACANPQRGGRYRGALRRRRKKEFRPRGNNKRWLPLITASSD